MSDANWSAIKEDKIELIETIKTWCEQTGFQMPDVNEKMRLDVINGEFDKLKKEYWDKVKSNNMIKIYTIKFDGTGWNTENPQDFKEELEVFEREYDMKMSADDVIRKARELEIGQEFVVEPISIKCREMNKEEYLNLPEFAGW